MREIRERLFPLVIPLLAVMAKPVSTGASPTLVLRDVTARRARAVVVVDAVRCWFRSLID